MTLYFKSFSATSLILLLSACGATTQTATQQKTQEPVAIAIPSVEAAVASLPATPEPEQEEVVLKPLPKIGVLMGKTRQEIEDVFGSPVLLRKDKPAEVWQYLTNDCALHLVFYPTSKAKSDNLTVQHISTNDRNEVIIVDTEACFGSQLRRVGEDRAQALS